MEVSKNKNMNCNEKNVGSNRKEDNLIWEQCTKSPN